MGFNMSGRKAADQGEGPSVDSVATCPCMPVNFFCCLFCFVLAFNKLSESWQIHKYDDCISKVEGKYLMTFCKTQILHHTEP